MDASRSHSADMSRMTTVLRHCCIMVFLLIFVFVLFASAQQEDCGCEAWRSVLRLFYNSTSKGGRWKNATGWSGHEELSVCFWYGLSCSGSEAQVSLDLSNNSLHGTLPEALGEVPMVSLTLSVNRLYGSLPSVYYQWGQSITHLDLTDNRISGSLPKEYASWKRLSVFFVVSNNISGTLPPEYAAWADTVVNFWVKYNPHLGGTLPRQYASWTNMQAFAVDGTNLSGTLPREYSEWQSLFMVSIVDTRHLSGTLPPEYARWTQLHSFHFHESNLSGTLPPEYSAWGDLLAFTVGNNQFTGSLPGAYSAWVKLSRFDVSRNDLSGSLPPQYQAWKVLQTFSPSNNKLTGVLPSEYSSWNSTTLRVFDVSSNRIAGTLPPSYASIIGFDTIFGLDNNDFSGTVPWNWPPGAVLFIHNNTHLGFPSSLQWLCISVCFTATCAHNVSLFYVTSTCQGGLNDAHEAGLRGLELFRFFNCSSGRNPCAGGALPRTLSPGSALSQDHQSAQPTSTPQILVRNSFASLVVLSGVFSPTLSLRRLSMMPRCTEGAALGAEVDWSNAPLALPSIKPASVGGAHRNAVLGNICIVACAVCFSAALVAGSAWWYGRKTHRYSFEVAAARCGLPGFLYLVVGLLYQQTVLSSAVLMATAPQQDSVTAELNRGVGIAGLLLTPLLNVAVLLWLLVLRFYAHAQRAHQGVEEAVRWRWCLQWLGGRSVTWVCMAGPKSCTFVPRKHFVECYGYMFRSCTAGRQWWLVVDVAATSILATLAGTAASAAPESSSCRAQQWLFVVVCGALCVAGYVLRPKQRRVALGSLWLSDGALFVMSLIHVISGDSADETAEIISLCAALFSLCAALLCVAADKLLCPNAPASSNSNKRLSKASLRPEKKPSRRSRTNQNVNLSPRVSVPRESGVLSPLASAEALAVLKTLIAAACRSPPV